MRFAALLLALPATLSAAETSAVAPYSVWGDFFNMLFTLGMLLAGLLLVTWFLKRMVRNRTTATNSTNAIRILEKRSLSQKSHLYLIEVLGKGVLIADSASGIQTLTEVGPSPALDELLQAKTPSPRASFAEILQKKLRKTN